ncbi:MAG: EAL domain-containing protein, partial [Nocardioidaceae bacterium]
AEEAGLTSILGELVLEMVAADAPPMRAASSGELFISVNVSAQQLRAPGFVASVLRARDALGEMALVLEITERQVVGDDPMVSSVIGQLEANGIRFALDDFGIGYSSIGYLQQLAVHVLKTDRLFSAHIDTDPRSMKLLVSMVEMGRALGLDVVIEGIERAAQVDELRRHVTFSDNLFFQGYLLAVPATVDETVRQLESAEKQPVLRAV